AERSEPAERGVLHDERSDQHRLPDVRARGAAPDVSARPNPLVMAITGASGAPYAIRTLEQLVAARRDVWLIVSRHGWRLLQTECGIAGDQLRDRVGAEGWDAHVTLFTDDDR